MPEVTEPHGLFGLPLWLWASQAVATSWRPPIEPPKTLYPGTCPFYGLEPHCLVVLKRRLRRTPPSWGVTLRCQGSKVGKWILSDEQHTTFRVLSEQKPWNHNVGPNWGSFLSGCLIRRSLGFRYRGQHSTLVQMGPSEQHVSRVNQAQKKEGGCFSFTYDAKGDFDNPSTCTISKEPPFENQEVNGWLPTIVACLASTGNGKISGPGSSKPKCWKHTACLLAPQNFAARRRFRDSSARWSFWTFSRSGLSGAGIWVCLRIA